MNNSGGGALSERLANNDMTSATRLLRIFWPSDVPRSRDQGTIVGWRNGELDIFAIYVLEDAEVLKTTQI